MSLEKKLNTKLAKLGIRCCREEDNEGKENLVYHIPESDQPEEVVYAVSSHARYNGMSKEIQLRTSPGYAEKLFKVANNLREIAEKQTGEREKNTGLGGLAGLTTAAGTVYFFSPEFADLGQQLSQYLGDNTTTQSFIGAPLQALTTWGLTGVSAVSGYIAIGETIEAAIKPLRYNKHTDNENAYLYFQNAALWSRKNYGLKLTPGE